MDSAKLRNHDQYPVQNTYVDELKQRLNGVSAEGRNHAGMGQKKLVRPTGAPAPLQTNGKATVAPTPPTHLRRGPPAQAKVEPAYANNPLLVRSAEQRGDARKVASKESGGEPIYGQFMPIDDNRRLYAAPSRPTVQQSNPQNYDRRPPNADARQDSYEQNASVALSRGQSHDRPAVNTQGSRDIKWKPVSPVQTKTPITADGAWQVTPSAQHVEVPKQSFLKTFGGWIARNLARAKQNLKQSLHDYNPKQPVPKTEEERKEAFEESEDKYYGHYAPRNIPDVR